MALGVLYRINESESEWNEDSCMLEPDKVTTDLGDRVSWCSGLTDSEWKGGIRSGTDNIEK